MRRAIAAFGRSGQVEVCDCFPGAAAFDRGGIHDPDAIAEQLAAGGQVHHDVLGHPGEVALAFVVAGLLRDVGEHAGQVGVGVAQEVPFGGVAQEGFHHGQDDEFAVSDTGLVAQGRSDGEEFGVGVEVVVGGDLKCKSESVQVVFHKFDP